MSGLAILIPEVNGQLGFFGSNDDGGGKKDFFSAQRSFSPGHCNNSMHNTHHHHHHQYYKKLNKNHHNCQCHYLHHNIDHQCPPLPVKMRLNSLTNFFVDLRGGAERTYWDPKDAWWLSIWGTQIWRIWRWCWRWWWCWCWCWPAPASPPPLSPSPGTFHLASPTKSKLVICNWIYFDWRRNPFFTFAAITQLAVFPERVESSNLKWKICAYQNFTVSKIFLNLIYFGWKWIIRTSRTSRLALYSSSDGWRWLTKHFSFPR